MSLSRILKYKHFVFYSVTPLKQSFDESELPIFLSEDEHINSEDESRITVSEQ